jgi:RHS repeat-associated protein
VDSRDAAGRVLQQTNTVAGAAALVEMMAWRANSTLASYGAARSGAGAWNETRAYAYDSRGQLLSEGFSPAVGQSSAITYAFDGSTTKLGIRTDAKVGTGTPVSWQSKAAQINSLGRVTQDQVGVGGKPVPVSGISLGADRVEVVVDNVPQGRATHPGPADPVGAWSMNLNLTAGSHTLLANSIHPSGQFTATASSTFTVVGSGSGLSGNVTHAYDGDGNVVSRTWTSGTTQTLSWDALGRLVKIAQRNGANTGYDWTAVYDGFGRRLKTSRQTITAGAADGAPTVTTSVYDPQVEFLEIGVAVNGAKAWKVYGPDLNGVFGSLQGTGGLEATITDADRSTSGVIGDQFGNGVAAVTGGNLSWFATRVGSYGPLPGSEVQTLTEVSKLAESTAWRGRRVDATGFIFLGARYYEPNGARFLSADPMGHGASMSLYDYCNGDPVNRFDPDGRVAWGNFGGLPRNAPVLSQARVNQLENTYGKYLNPVQVYKTPGEALMSGALRAATLHESTYSENEYIWGVVRRDDDGKYFSTIPTTDGKSDRVDPSNNPGITRAYQEGTLVLIGHNHPLNSSRMPYELSGYGRGGFGDSEGRDRGVAQAYRVRIVAIDPWGNVLVGNEQTDRGITVDGVDLQGKDYLDLVKLLNYKKKCLN